MRNFRIISIFCAATFWFSMTSWRSFGQDLSKPRLLERQSAAVAEPAPPAQEQGAASVSDPVTVKLKRGDVLSANLIEGGAETITIEVDGKLLEINLNEVESIIQQARLFDKFYDIPFDDEKARLDNFAIALQQDPSAVGYIIVFGRLKGRPGEAKRRADRDKGYLVEERGISYNRIVSLDHCFSKKITIELWLVPNGAPPPDTCRAVQTKSSK